MKAILIAMVELLCCLLLGCASTTQADNGAFAAAEFVEVVEVSTPKIEPTPDPISVDDIMPQKPIPHASCKCSDCKCEPACVGACAIQPPAEVKAALQMRCANGQCYPVRRGIFGWRR